MTAYRYRETPPTAPPPSERTPWWDELAAALVKVHDLGPPVKTWRVPPLREVAAAFERCRPYCARCGSRVEEVTSYMDPMRDAAWFVVMCHGESERRMVTGLELAAAAHEPSGLIDRLLAPYFVRAP